MEGIVQKRKIYFQTGGQKELYIRSLVVRKQNLQKKISNLSKIRAEKTDRPTD